MVLPRSAGTFLISRVAISFIDSAVSSMSVISVGSMSCMLTRSFRVQGISHSSVGFARLAFGVVASPTAAAPRTGCGSPSSGSWMTTRSCPSCS